MTPLLEYALFVKEVVPQVFGVDLLGVHNLVSMVSPDPQQIGLTLHQDTLVVAVLAADGDHTLLIKHRNSDWLYSVRLRILPEHGQAFIQIVEAEFPALVRPYPALNEYALLLDGVGIGSAYLNSNPL